MKTVYLLCHFQVEKEQEWDENEDSQIIIGIYSTKENAESEIDKIIKQPGFNNWPSGFRIFSYELNKGEWSEGFVDPYDDSDGSNPEKK